MNSNKEESGGATIAEPNQLAPHIEPGRHGETLAIEHLACRLSPRAANFRLPTGRNTRDVIVNAEIDVVAYDGPTPCFVEVKTRGTDEFAPPQVNVDLRKRRRIARAARGYRRTFGLFDAPYRYDVGTVVSASARQVDGEPRIELLKNFWTDEKLRQRNWRAARWD